MDPALPVVVKGLANEELFCRCFMKNAGYLDTDRIEEEIVGTARKITEEHPSVKAILLECADLPPYSRAVQEATGLPVFDFFTMINYVFSAVVQKRFEGFM